MLQTGTTGIDIDIECHELVHCVALTFVVNTQWQQDAKGSMWT
jgi:hypothetical protein